VGFAIMTGLVIVDYRWFRRLAWPLYGILILALIGLLIRGEAIKGARSWYDLGPVSLQPSEPGKIIVALALARYLSARSGRFRSLRHTIVPIAIAGLPMALILAQPDLGTAMVLAPLAGSMFWAAGLRKWVVALFVLAGIAVAAAGYPHLKPYQKERIMTFLNPEADPRGKGYNIIQAQTALGSGQILGKGWGRGTQTAFKFLPEYRTDFIFPTVGEQFGFVGCAAVLGLLTLLILRMTWLATKAQNMFGVLLTTGLAAALSTHIILNIGMTVGLLPVTGLPLPFFSYGGSFMLTCLSAVGLAVSVGARRDM
jgi:rod shape determining protein RodA